jgi:hypothetical protein
MENIGQLDSQSTIKEFLFLTSQWQIIKPIYYQCCSQNRNFIVVCLKLLSSLTSLIRWHISIFSAHKTVRALTMQTL